MGDMEQLERQIFAKPKSAAANDLMTLAGHYRQKYDQETDARTKIKWLKQAGYFAGWAGRSGGLSKENLDVCLEILRVEKKAGSSEHVGRDLPAVMFEWLKVQGIADPAILKEVKGQVSVESGVVGAGDPGKRVTGDEDISDEGLRKLEGEGRGLFIGTGGDGTFGVKIRLVSGSEPVLAIAEYKKLIESQETKISIESGKIAVADIWELDSLKALGVDLENGSYKIAAYFFDSSKFFGYILVLCKVNPPD